MSEKKNCLEKDKERERARNEKWSVPWHTVFRKPFSIQFGIVVVLQPIKLKQ